MSRISMALIFSRTKDLSNKLDIFLDWFEEVIVLVIFMMRQRPFDEMSRIVAVVRTLVTVIIV
jgi:hypothetical protein